MISFEEAFKIVMDSALRTGVEVIPFTEADGRVIAEDVFSDIDMPPFNRSAVDGYACRASDLDNELKIIEVIPAGKQPEHLPGKNECSKIMTGAIVPDSCNIVFMVEDAEVLPGGKVRFKGRSMKSNISFKSEDVSAGDIVIRKGKYLRPQDIAVIASVGHVDVVVSKKPLVGIISTGDELVEPSVKPRLSQIRNSNSYQLLSQVKRAGGIGHYYGIAPDTGDLTFDLLTRAIDENDIVLLTGGVSMGDFDFVPAFLTRAGVKILFDKVNVQPGKPTTFGVHRDALIFGLPGNPVSSFIQFETLVQPLMNLMTGSDRKAIIRKVPLGRRYERKSASRMGWVPVIINERHEAIPVEYHGSAHISALPYTDGIFSIMPEQKILEKGTLVDVRYI